MNHLTAAVKGSASANFWYDGLGRICTWQQNGSGFARFNVWDGWNLVAEYNGSNVDTEYLHGAGSDELVSMTRGGQTYYFLQDGRGNTSQVTDDSGVLVETCKYDVHGAPTVTVAPGKTATGNRFLFTGREYFSVVGLYNFRNRFYLPSLGRFLQADPIGFAGDPANLYRYCGNNPVNESDPTGLGNKLDGVSDGTGKYIPLGSHIPLAAGASVYSAFNFPSGYSSTNGWGSVSGRPGASAPSIPVRRATDVNGRYSDGSLSFPATPLGQILGAAADLVGKIWTLPNTVIGTLIGIASLPFGGEIHFANNSIQFTNVPSGPGGALTLGNVELYNGSVPTDPGVRYNGAPAPPFQVGYHEQGHTYQYQGFGPFFLPAYLLNGGISARNPFENAADDYAVQHSPPPPGGP